MVGLGKLQNPSAVTLATIARLVVDEKDDAVRGQMNQLLERAPQ